VRYLLDTHAVLWSAGDPQKLPEYVKTMLIDTYDSKYVSIISNWEVAIKLEQESFS
jgi:PIN domain nuclease of toxin-antitoxin system